MKLLLTLSFLILSISPDAHALLKKGDDAPCVVLAGISPTGKNLRECIRNTVNPSHKYTIIKFFSIDCSTCQKDLPTMAKLATDLAGKATVRLVSIDKSAEEVKKFIKSSTHKEHFTFPVAFDVQQAAAEAYDVNLIPALLVLKKQSSSVFKVALSHAGGMNEATVREIHELVK
jgi:thiol-disulfide isomerase/thioredoxin